MRFEREFYRPKDARVEYPEDLPGAEIHRYENGSRAPNSKAPFAAVFGGKRSKPDWHFRFKDNERREEKIAEWMEQEKDSLIAAKNRRAEHNGGHTLEVGDVLSGSWGYDQTNVDFYQITEVPSKCFVMAQKIGGKTNRESGSAIFVVPVKDSFEEGSEPKRYKAGPDNSISIASYLHPSKTNWEDEHYETHWAYGH